MTRPALVLLLFAFAGCSAHIGETPNSADIQEPKPNANQTLCEDPRGQVCTRDYRPVCGTDNEGESKTYSNACTACTNAAVLVHQQGECR